MTNQLPRRSEAPQELTWDVHSIFPSDAAWQAALEQVAAALPSAAQYAGRLGESGATLLAYLQARDTLLQQLDHVTLYASMRRDVDLGDQAAAALYDRAQALAARVRAALAFEEPELLALSDARIAALIDEEPGLESYTVAFQRLRRRRAHIRSPEVEELLAQASEPLGTSYQTFSMLANADLEFQPAYAADGSSAAVAHGTITRLLSSPDRALRESAWRSYADGHVRFKNSLASCLIGSIRRDVFYARARRYPSALEASLDTHNIPLAVFDTTIDTFRKHLPLWHRYWRVRRQALDVDLLQPYDIFAPLTSVTPQVSFQQAVDWICDGMAPLGDEYVTTLRRGVLEQRWVDVYPNQGKRGGAYSTGAYGTHPFLLLNHSDDLMSMSVFAHELGHSLHTFFSAQAQPYVYADYSLFVAEVASNFNQALVRAHLLATQPDPAFQIAVIEEAMMNFHRYFFIMPTLARFEREVHERVERGQAVTADTMSALLTDLFREGYGGEVAIDEVRVGITWAQFVHLHANFYAYQYTTGIAAAHALANQVLSGAPGAADRYMQFLRTGDALDPLDALRRAGVDMASPEPVERTFAVLAQLIDRLEELTSARA